MTLDLLVRVRTAGEACATHNDVRAESVHTSKRPSLGVLDINEPFGVSAAGSVTAIRSRCEVGVCDAFSAMRIVCSLENQVIKSAYASAQSVLRLTLQSPESQVIVPANALGQILIWESQ